MLRGKKFDAECRIFLNLIEVIRVLGLFAFHFLRAFFQLLARVVIEKFA